MRRVVVFLVDGLRPDAISPGVAPSLHALGAEFTVALRASTVRPSATVPALASLATGVAPATHHLTEPGLSFLSTLGFLRPVARELAHHGIPTEVVTAAPAARSPVLRVPARVRSSGARPRLDVPALPRRGGRGRCRHRRARRVDVGHGVRRHRGPWRRGDVDRTRRDASRERAHPADRRGPGCDPPPSADPAGLAARRAGDGVVVVRGAGPAELRGPGADRGVRPGASRGGGGDLMRWLTHLGGARATLGAGVLLLTLSDRRLGAAVLVANAVSHLVVQVLKRAFARPRPCDAMGRPLALVDLPDPHSFPS